MAGRRFSLPAPFTATGELLISSPKKEDDSGRQLGLRRSSSASVLKPRRHSLPSCMTPPSPTLVSSTSVVSAVAKIKSEEHWLSVAERESRVFQEKRSGSKEFAVESRQGSKDSSTRSFDRRDSVAVESRQGSKESSTKSFDRRDSVSSVASTASTSGVGKSPSLGRTSSLPLIHRITTNASPTQAKAVAFEQAISEGASADEEPELEIEDLRLRIVYGKLGKPKIRKALDQLVRELLSAKMTHEELFVRIDTNGDGLLQRKELQQELRKLGVTLLPIELDGLLRAFDIDCSGEVDFDEFFGLLKLHEARMPKEAEKMPTPLAEDVGARVRYMMRMQGRDPDLEERNQDASVVGPGLTPGTVLINRDIDGTEISVKSCFLKRLQDCKDF